MYGNEKSKKIFTTTHAEPRDYTFQDKIKEDLKAAIYKLEASKTGKFIFAANNSVICIYNHVESKRIYKYTK